MSESPRTHLVLVSVLRLTWALATSNVCAPEAGWALRVREGASSGLTKVTSSLHSKL